MNKVNILGKDFEVFWSTQAMKEISDMCGRIDKIDKYIYGDDKSDVAGIYERFSGILEILVNAAIKRDNYAKSKGFMQGDPVEQFEAGDLSIIIGIGDIGEMIQVMFKALADDTEYEIPEGVDIDKKEVDETLEEIKENRRKKEESGE